MAVPRQDGTIGQRLKILEEEIRVLRGLIGAGSGDTNGPIVDAQGNVIFSSDLDAGQGILKPRLGATITTPNLGTTITSATWVEAFSVAGRRQNASWEVRFNVVADSGTTGQLRAVIAGTTTELHAPVAVGDGENFLVGWTLDLPADWDSYVIVEIQAERLTGSGNIRVRPYSAAGG